MATLLISQNNGSVDSSLSSTGTGLIIKSAQSTAQLQFNVNGTIDLTGGLIENTIDFYNYGTTTTLTTANRDVQIGASGSGATAIDLNTSVVPVGQTFIIKDFGCNASTNNITLDAGGGNTIHGHSSTQTYVLNVNGQAAILKKVSSTSWSIDTTAFNSTIAGGSNTQLQYNNSGTLAGVTGATTDGTSLTLTKPIFVAGTTTKPALTLTAGTNLTSPSAGAIEWDGTHLYATQTSGPTRKTVAYTSDITLSIGESITGGTASYVIFGDTSNNLQQIGSSHGTAIQIIDDSTINQNASINLIANKGVTVQNTSGKICFQTDSFGGVFLGVPTNPTNAFPGQSGYFYIDDSSEIFMSTDNKFTFSNGTDNFLNYVVSSNFLTFGLSTGTSIVNLGMDFAGTQLNMIVGSNQVDISSNSIVMTATSGNLISLINDNGNYGPEITFEGEGAPYTGYLALASGFATPGGAGLSADRQWGLPDKDGTIAMLSDIVTGGTSTHLLYNNSGSTDTISGATTDGTTITATNLIVIGSSNAAMAATGQYYSSEHDNGNVTTTATINWNNGNVQYVTMTGATTFTFSNPKAGGRYVLFVAGAFTPTFPGTVRWASSSTPTPTATSGKKDIYTFIYSGKESLYDGAINANFATT